MKPLPFRQHRKQTGRRILEFIVAIGVPNAPAIGASLSVAPVLAGENQSINAPIILKDGADVVGAQFQVSYNPARIYPGAALIQPGSDGQRVKSHEIAPGIVRVLVYNRENLPISRTALAEIPLSYSNNASVGPEPLAINNVILARQSGTELTPVSLISGYVHSSPVQRSPDGNVHLVFESDPQRVYALEGSSNMIHWSSLATNTAIAGFVDWIRSDTGAQEFRFYRTRTPP